MIRTTLLFELRHPWLTMLLYMGSILLGMLLLGLPAWGWVELRFSPVQRHYLPLYAASSVSLLAVPDPESAAWIVKRAPGRKWEIAAPEDLVSAEGEGAPFALSPAARAEGWKELGGTEHGEYWKRDLRKFLREEFFSGRSFLMLVLEPLEILLLGFLSWKVFAVWREDLPLFMKALAGEAKIVAAWCWRWTGKPAARWAGQWVRERRRSRTEPAIAMPGEPAPPPMPAIEVVSVQSPKPVVPAASTPKPAPDFVPRSPFGLPPADGEPVRKWDISQWIN